MRSDGHDLAVGYFRQLCAHGEAIAATSFRAQLGIKDRWGVPRVTVDERPGRERGEEAQRRVIIVKVRHRDYRRDSLLGACAGLHSLLAAHPVDRRGRCRSCRVRGDGWDTDAGCAWSFRKRTTGCGNQPTGCRSTWPASWAWTFRRYPMGPIRRPPRRCPESSPTRATRQPISCRPRPSRRPPPPKRDGRNQIAAGPGAPRTPPAPSWPIG